MLNNLNINVNNKTLIIFTLNLEKKTCWECKGLKFIAQKS